MVLDAVIGGDDTHAVAVGAVGGDEHVVCGADGGAQGGLHAECPAALHQHGCIVFRTAGGKRHQFFTDFLDDADVVVFIPRAPVAHHGFLDSFAGGQRAGGQK